MPDRPMRFCASTSKCASAYTVGAPGTVKIAADREPVSEERINDVLSFLATRLSDEDMAQVTDMLDDVVDQAEDLNPTKAMAKDALPASARRIIRRARRNVKLGYDARPAGLMATLAADQADLNAAFPHRNRLSGGNSMGYVQPMPSKRTQPVGEADRTRRAAMFPHMERLK